MPILVKEVMSSPAITIDYKKTAKVAGNTMRKNRKGFLVVTKKGSLIGVLSDSDLINKIVAKGRDPSKLKVENLMNSPIVTASPSEEIMGVIKKMKKNNVHRLPVVDRGKVLGIVSLTDIARSSPDMYYLLEYRQKMKEHPFILKEKITSGICNNCGNFSDHLKETQDDRWFCETCRDELESEY